MAETLRVTIERALGGVIDPASGRSITELGWVKALTINGGRVSFVLDVPPEGASGKQPVRDKAEAAVKAVPGVTAVMAVLTAHQDPASRSPGARPGQTPARGAALSAGVKAQGDPGAAASGPKTGIPGIKHVVAVASGKGGVGKSTTAVNLALALKAQGLAVGLLDADIYGPSVPRLLGITGKPQSDGKKLQAMEAFGLKAMSIGFLVDEDTPMIWRGPMVMSALTQMMNDVAWGELDVLIVDMPPGTGDAQLTMAQRVPLAGAVIVSTPQDIALIDARKGIAMFEKTKVPVIGIVENMSLFCCPNCGHVTPIFGHGGAKETAAKLGADFLGEVPLHLDIRTTSDEGRPIVATSAQSAEAAPYFVIADKVRAFLDKGGQKPAPRIVMG